MNSLRLVSLCFAAAAAVAVSLPASAQPPLQCDAGGDCGTGATAAGLRMLGPQGRATVISPSRRSVEPQVVAREFRVLIPGCHKLEAGVFLCETVYEYQHCRTLMRAGTIFGCRAGLAFDGAFAEPIAAARDAYTLDVESKVELTVRRGERGAGEAKGQARFEIDFSMPAAAAGETCLQRQRYVYYPTGPKGGLAEIDDSADCGEPIEGVVAPHEDDVLQAYDSCEAFAAWGSELEQPIELMVAALYHLAPTSAAADKARPSRIVAPYATISAPMQVICRE